MTIEQASALISQHFSAAQLGDGRAPLVVTLPAEQWLAFGRFAKETLGCRFFAFSSAVDWKEQGLEVVARVDKLNLPSYTGFVQPKLTAVTRPDGAITDVTISYPMDFTAQMLEYSGVKRP